MAPREATLACQSYEGATEAVPGREALVDEFIPTIKYHASVLKHRLPPNIEMDDLVSSGIVGLLDAAERFDASRGIKFKTYAEFRIRGTMLDYLREMDYFPRSARQHAQRLQNAYGHLEAQLGRAPDEREIAKYLEIPLDELRKQLALYAGLSVFSLDEPVPDGEGSPGGVQMLLYEAAMDKSREAELLRDLREVLSKAIDMLPDKEKALVALYYYEELTMKEIGGIFDLGEPRICQLHAQAILRLRGKLKSHFEK